MSRDAKIGLVIVFAFVFLFGTILVHRLQPGATTEGPREDASKPTEGDAEAALVEARSVAPPEPRRTESTRGQQPGMILLGVPRSDRDSVSSGPPEEPNPPTGSSGQIILTGPATTRQSAEVAEPGHSSRTGRADSSATEADLQPISPPRDTPREPDPDGAPLRIVGSRDNTAQRTTGTPKPEPEPMSAPGGVATPEEAPVREMPEPAASTRGSVGNQSTPAESSLGSSDPVRSADPPAPREEPDEPGSAIQQAAGRQPKEKPKAPPNDDSDLGPPKLPKFGSQPTIESVPDAEPRASSDSIRRQPPNEPTARSRPAFDTRPRDDEAFGPSRSSPSKAISTRTEPLGGQKTYVVKEGDSFWSISARFYGTGKYFRELEKYNWDRLRMVGGDLDPRERHLVPGLTIVVPDVSELRSTRSTPKTSEPPTANFSDTTSRRPRPASSESSRFDPPATPGTYRVKQGDTLSTISQEQLGTAKRWQEIYELNRDRIPDERRLKVGTELRLPPARPGERIADRPTSGR